MPLFSSSSLVCVHADQVVEALKDMDCEVRIKEGVAAATGIHKVRACHTLKRR